MDAHMPVIDWQPDTGGYVMIKRKGKCEAEKGFAQQRCMFTVTERIIVLFFQFFRSLNIKHIIFVAHNIYRRFWEFSVYLLTGGADCANRSEIWSV